MARILHLDHDSSVSLVVEEVLSRGGHSPVAVQTVPEALLALSLETVDLVLADEHLPGMTGIEFLQLLQRQGYDIPLIMLAGSGSSDHLMATIRAGAIYCITKPVRAQQLELAVERALEYSRVHRENAALRREAMEARNEREIVGESTALRRVLDAVATVAQSNATVLLQGETGTGKDLLAHAIHNRSDRRDRPFVKLNCAALPEALIESALFGHERGAFTGAVKRVEGAFERAYGGTLLLEEISVLKLELQPRLLRVLQEQEFERMGGTVPTRVDVRLIATTSRSLAQEAADGNFRQDLYYRLSVMPIKVPPLRDHPEDIVPLALRFAMQTAAEMKKEVTGFAPETLRLLMDYPWPGNVRELQHAMERAVILTREPVLQPHVFQAQRATGSSRPVESAVATSSPSDEFGTTGGERIAPSPGGIVLHTLNVADAERALIRRSLEVTGGNRTRAAKLLGISVRTLRNKLNARPDREDKADRRMESATHAD